MEAVQKLPEITYGNARQLLAKSHLHILKDRYFGDSEYHWMNPLDAQQKVAEGYFGAGDGSISFNGYSTRFTGDLAYDLRMVYHTVSTSHNDLQGE